MPVHVLACLLSQLKHDDAAASQLCDGESILAGCCVSVRRI